MNASNQLTDTRKQDTEMNRTQVAAYKRMNRIAVEKMAERRNAATSTLEPQTAEYQAAMDNVWFEMSKNARQQIASWSMGKRWEDDGRISYITDLEIRMELALGRKNNLGYSLENF